MTVGEMHYDFKMKTNKVDSQKNRNFIIPEIDWLLNEAQEIFIKNIAEPRHPNSYLGFETSQRTIEDIRPLVTNKILENAYGNAKIIDNIAILPSDYMFFIRGRASMDKMYGTVKCSRSDGVIYIRQHDDQFDQSNFDKSSFEWRTVNALFIDKGLKLFITDFTITKLSISYIRKPAYINNAQKFTGGNYKLPDGVTTLSVNQNCELPAHTHRDIVDIAVMLASGVLQGSDYAIKKDKVNTVNQFN